MNEPLAGRRLVSFTMSPNRLAELRKYVIEQLSSGAPAWFDGVALYVADDLADDRYIETYHDGTIRMVIEEGPTINLDEPQTVSHYFGILKPRPRHQRPLRNLRNRSV